PACSAEDPGGGCGSVKHKRQHFIPRCYLKAWCDPTAPPSVEPYVWVFSKDGGSKKRKAPDNILHETDMYTIVRADGSRDLVLERGLQQLESDFATIRRKTLENKRPLDPVDRIKLCAFIAAMHCRTKSYREFQREQWKKPLDMMERAIEW